MKLRRILSKKCLKWHKIVYFFIKNILQRVNNYVIIPLYHPVHLFLVIDGKILVENRKNREYCNGQYDVIASHILGWKNCE